MFHNKGDERLAADLGVKLTDDPAKYRGVALADERSDEIPGDTAAFAAAEVNARATEPDDPATALPLAVLGQGEYATAVVGKSDGSVKSEPFDWVPQHVDMSFRIGYRSGILDCINTVLTSHLSAADRCRLVDAFAALKLPADTTRQG